MTELSVSMPKTAGPWVDISLTALCANYAMIRNAAPGGETAAVVKCDAYGLGVAAAARALEERENCATFFVAYPEEGAQLRPLLQRRDAKIYVFNGPLPETTPLFREYSLTPVLNSLEQASKWSERMPGEKAALHIDTGMNRLGADVSELDDIIALNDLNIDMVMSHLACANDPGNAKNMRQRDQFLTLAQKCPDARKSLSASGGALMGKEYHFDLLRPGVALYGGSPFDEDDARIKPVCALRAPVVQVRTISPGETVGYGAAFTAEHPVTLATIALGYGDGYPRAAFGNAEAELNGHRAPLVGRISMDLITLDISSVPGPVETGAVTTLFGGDISLFEAAAWCRAIPYEMLTGLGGRVDRRYV